MNSINKTARIVGVLYIIGTIAGMVSLVLTEPILGDPDYLAKVSANEIQIIAGALFVLIMGFALAMVPVMMFPILKKYNEALALGYVVFRGALETVMYIVLAISWAGPDTRKSGICESRNSGYFIFSIPGHCNTRRT